MKIIYHHRTRAEDAQGIHINEIVKALKELGCDVTVVGLISHDSNQNSRSESSILSRIAANVPAFIFELMEIFYNFYGVYRIRKEIKISKPDFIYERYALFNVTGLIVSKIYAIPLIEEVNSPLSLEKKAHAKLVLQKVAGVFEKTICSHAHKTIVVSTSLKKIMMRLGVPEKKMVVISNGVNTSRFNPDVDGTKIRERYNLRDKIVIGFVGWFRKWHGLEELLEIYAANEMVKKNIHILLVGDGPAFESLVRIAKKYGLFEKGVVFTGPVEREYIPEHIAAFDLALQPDVTDYASPIKLFEYISMGKGVIAPDKENIIEILSENYPGLFKTADWKDMGRVILDATSSSRKIDELSSTVFRVFTEKQYYWSRNAEKTIDLLKFQEGE